MANYAFKLDLSDKHTTTLFVLNISTLACLQFFADDQAIELSDFGATAYQHYGWATQSDIPCIYTVEQLKRLLEADDIGLYTLTVTIDHTVILHTFCDSKATIHFRERSQCMAFIQAMIPDEQQNRFINALVKNPECFIHLGLNGEITQYASIDAFQAKHG